MTKYILVFAYLLCEVALAQTPKPFVTIESPNSSALKGGVETPMSLYSGKANVSIPLETLVQGDITVPILLNYNTGGVKLDMHPGWVGQNFNLEAGGSITRNIKGVPDEFYWRNDFRLTDGGNATGTTVYPYGYFFNSSINATTSWDSPTKISDLAKAPNWVEAEPDEFVFQCGQYSGKFYLDHTGRIRVQGRPDIYVEGHVVMNIPMYDAAKALNVNDPDTYTSSHIALSTDQGNIYSFNRIKKAMLMGFRITTPDGIQYEFGMWGENYSETDLWEEVEFTADLFSQFYYDEIFTTWHLKRIKSPHGHVVNFVYERSSPVIQAGHNYSFYKGGGTAPAKGFLGFLFGEGPSHHTSEAKFEMSGRFVRPTYLRKITSADFTVDFTRSQTTELEITYDWVAAEIYNRSRFYDRGNDDFSNRYNRFMIMSSNAPPYLNANNLAPGVIKWAHKEYSVVRADGWIEDLYFDGLKWFKLDNIKISRANGETIKEFDFLYNNISTERLQLLSVKEKGVSGSIPPYVFQYDQSQTLPHYNSFKIDHWGYFNNTNSIATININVPQTLIDYKNFREPNADYLYAGSLKKITTPTGGAKELTYEPNTYNAYVQRDKLTGAFSVVDLTTPKTGGGLRIKTLTEKFGESNSDIVHNYVYENGILNGNVQYYWADYKGKLFNGNEYTSTRFVTESLLPVSDNPGGGVVGYSKVSEFITGNGKTEYQYTNLRNNLDDNGVTIDPEKSPYTPFSSKVFERGLLKEKKVFNQQNVIQQSETYNYMSNSVVTAQFVRSVSARGLTLFGATTLNAIEGTAYKHFVYPYNIITKEASTYNSSGVKTLTSVSTIEYNDVNFVKSEKATNSEGIEKKTSYTYVLDQAALNPNGPYAAMAAKGIVSPKIEQIEINTQNNQELTRQKNTYDGLFNTDGSKYVLKPQKIESSFLNGVVSTDVTFNAYDAIGNILQYTTRNGSINSFQWGYNNRYPVAKLVGAKNTSGQYKPTVAILGTSGFGGGGVTGTISTSTVNFRVDFPGQIRILGSGMSNTTTGGQSGHSISLNITGSISGSYTISTTSAMNCSSPPQMLATIPVTPGDYVLNITLTSQGPNWGTCVQILDIPQMVVSTDIPQIKEFFYESFEEQSSAVTVTPLVGKKYYNGDYTVPFTMPNSKSYWVDYRYLSGSVWTYTRKAFTNNIVLTEGSAIDEVRVYPIDAMITTYTYLPLVGMSTETDTNGLTQFYEYDGLNRVKVIRDADLNIVKQFEYKYIYK